MTPEEVATSLAFKRTEWEKHTGLRLLTTDPAETARSNRRRLRERLLRNKEEAEPDEG